MQRVIIESPYAGDIKRNLKYLQRCIKDCLDRGEAPFASHLMYTGCLDDTNPDERELGLIAGFVWRSVADKTVVYTDYGYSKGMEMGIIDAQEIHHGIEERMIGINE